MMAKQRPPALDLTNGRPLQQGDVFVHAVVALSGPDSSYAPVPTGVGRLASFPTPPDPALDVVGARCLVIVVSHDCHLDKELNQRAHALMKQDPDLREDDAYARAEADPSLDRNIVVSPVLALGGLPAAADPGTAGLLRAGRMVGYLPLPMQDPVLAEDSAVDLGIRATVDRLTLTGRLASSTDATRLALRYALAKMDSLRTPDVGAEVEAMIGKQIASVDRPSGKDQHLRLVMTDESAFDLLPRPAAAPTTGHGRSKAP